MIFNTVLLPHQQLTPLLRLSVLLVPHLPPPVTLSFTLLTQPPSFVLPVPISLPPVLLPTLLPLLLFVHLVTPRLLELPPLLVFHVVE